MDTTNEPLVVNNETLPGIINNVKNVKVQLIQPLEPVLTPHVKNIIYPTDPAEANICDGCQ